MSDNAIIVIIVAVVILFICIIAGTFKSKSKKKKKRTHKHVPPTASARTPSVPGTPSTPSPPSAVNTAVSAKKIDYAPIVEMTRVISDSDAHTIEKMRLLARDYSAFVAQHQDWCDSAARRTGSNDRHVLITNFFALWLSGFSVGGGMERNPSGRFGCHIAGNETPKTIMRSFEEIERSLNYGLDIENINVSEAGDTTKMIAAVSRHLSNRRYTLISLEAGSAGLYLFIVPTKDYDRVIQSSEKVDFKIYRQILT